MIVKHMFNQMFCDLDHKASIFSSSTSWGSSFCKSIVWQAELLPIYDLMISISLSSTSSSSLS